MSLRELYEQDAPTTPRGCRLTRWVDGFDGDDTAFLLELLGSSTATDQIMRWIAKNNLPVISKDTVNDHRRGRCTCAADAPGRMQ